MVEHIFAQVEFKVVDQMGQSPDGKPMRMKVLVIFNPGEENKEHWILPMPTEIAHTLARGLMSGLVMPNGGASPAEQTAIEQALRQKGQG